MPSQTARRTHARPAHARTAAGRSAAPRHHRRVSGPARPQALRGLRPVPAGAVAGGRALPRTRPQQRTSAFERLGRLPDHRLVDGLLRSRGWIVVIGVLLGGIVAMQVSLLKLNSGISRAVETSATLERQNADMQANIARLSSSQRISTRAAGENMVFPPAGDVRYLNVHPDRDAALAAKRMTAPSAAAEALMAAGGHGTATASTATTATTPTTATTTPTPATTTATSATTPTSTTTPSTTTPTSAATTAASTATTPTSTTAPATTTTAATTAATAATAGQG